MYNLLILIGLAFFIKVFFDGVKNIFYYGRDSAKKVSKRAFLIHAILGVVFIIIGRILLVYY